MAKVEKVFYKGIEAFYEDDGLVTYLTLDEEESIEPTKTNITNEIKTLLKEVGDGKITIEVKKFIEKAPPIRKPIFKYICSECGKVIKSEIEDLHAECKDCEMGFVTVE